MLLVADIITIATLIGYDGASNDTHITPLPATLRCALLHITRVTAMLTLWLAIITYALSTIL